MVLKPQAEGQPADGGQDMSKFSCRIAHIQRQINRSSDTCRVSKIALANTGEIAANYGSTHFVELVLWIGKLVDSTVWIRLC